MAINIVMPRLGLAMEEGTIVRWLKKEHEEVKEGEMLLEVQTDKVVMEVESTDSGILKKILVEEGGVAAVNQPIAILTAEGEEYQEPPAEEQSEAQPPPEKEPETKATSVRTGDAKILATPAAKALAREKGIDLKKVPSSKARISREDVEAYLSAENVKATPQSDREPNIVPLTGTRKVTAEHMAAAARTTAPVTLMADTDATAIVALRKKYKEFLLKETGVKVTYTDILIKLVAIALEKHPVCHSYFTEMGIDMQEAINIGIAVDTPTGLYVPVIKNANKKGLAAISAERQALIDKAKNGKLSMEDMTGGTFTITNLGMKGVKYFTPIINIPQTCILGVGKMDEHTRQTQSGEETQYCLYLSFVFDHRAVDGAPAAQCLQDICDYIANPERGIL